MCIPGPGGALYQGQSSLLSASAGFTVDLLAPANANTLQRYICHIQASVFSQRSSLQLLAEILQSSDDTPTQTGPDGEEFSVKKAKDERGC